MDAKIKEAKGLVAEAEKALKTGLFKWKPDYEYAGELLDKAANLFKLARDHQSSLNTYLRSAEAHRACGALFHAAKALENGALAAKELKDNAKAVEMTREAARLYRTHGVHDAGAIALEKAAKQAELNGDYEGALEMWIDVVDIREDEDQLRQAKIPLQKAIGLCVRQKHWEKAVELLDKQTEVMSKIGSQNLFQQNILSKVGIHLLRGDFVAAEKVYMSALEQQPRIANSDESAIINRLLEAYESNDQEALKHVLGEQAITFLDNDIALAFRHITIDEGNAGGSSSARGVNLNNPDLPSLVVKKGSIPSDPVAARAELFGCKPPGKKATIPGDTPATQPAPPTSHKRLPASEVEDEDPFDAEVKVEAKPVRQETPEATEAHHEEEEQHASARAANEPSKAERSREEEEEEEEEDPFASASSAPAESSSTAPHTQEAEPSADEDLC